MATDVDVCNQALSLLGGKSITSLDDTDSVSKTCKIHYQSTVDWVLGQREWRCAVKRASLTSPGTPNHGWSYSYDLPSDHLRTLAVRSSVTEDWLENPLKWQQEDGKILCDAETTVHIKYLYQVAIADVPAHLVDLIACQLAVRLAIPIADSRSLKEDLRGEYKEMLTDAAATDGMQGRTRQLRSSRALKVRRSSANLMGPYV